MEKIDCPPTLDFGGFGLDVIKGFPLIEKSA
jgi:hypothetical protein